MGVLTDFVVADPNDAARVGRSECPYQDFNGLDAKGIDDVKLCNLYSILTGTPFDPSVMGENVLLFVGSDSGPWVQQVPPDLVKRLAQLSSEELDLLAAKWSKTEEFLV